MPKRRGRDAKAEEVATDNVDFSRCESTLSARTRLESLSGLNLAELFHDAFLDSPAPDVSLTNLERWLSATTSPRIHLEMLVAQPRLARLLVTLIGASQPLADSLIQNPELASVVLDPEELARPVDVQELIDAGRSLMAASTSPSHSLDRLRFLRQRWMLSITVNDLEGTWDPERVWRALSDLADALIQLALEAVWKSFASERGLKGECPIGVIAFGKLGGQELNYSSDIDLSYVALSEDAEFNEREGTRFCEMFGRALSDRMGRGMLYRVDLRLRPYGKAGPILNSFRSIEAYYKLYAEPWELQALIRSRVVVGSPSLRAAWEDLVVAHCFKPTLSELALTSMLDSRSRTEATASSDDLKRGAGGIRDVEFLTQILQLVHGHAHAAVRTKSTCAALRALRDIGAMGEIETHDLLEGYTFLRQIEHRCQLVGDNQTHSVPESEPARQRLAKSMRLPGWNQLDALLVGHRTKIETLYKTTLSNGPMALDARDEVLHRLGSLSGTAAQWLDPLAGSAEFYRSLSGNESSLKRVAKILRSAPKLLTILRDSLPLTEAVLSGEIEEQIAGDRRIRSLPTECNIQALSTAYTASWTAIVARWALGGDFNLGKDLSALLDALLVHCARRLYAEFDIIALGSYGREELGIESDADLLLLIGDPSRHDQAEKQAQDLLALASKLHRMGAPIQIDLRLRPEGRHGLLVRTYDGLRSYELEGMEMWERFALGQARSVYGSAEALELVNKVAYAQPLTPERLRELLAMKSRIESERVAPRYIKRDVKLGHGGLSDIEWFLHIMEMRYPTAVKAGTARHMADRIRALGRASLINAIEMDELLQAHEYLLTLRWKLALLGIEGSVLPENPDRLDLLAAELGDADGNALLRRHERIVDTVRAIFNDGMERLKA